MILMFAVLCLYEPKDFELARHMFGKQFQGLSERVSSGPPVGCSINHEAFEGIQSLEFQPVRSSEYGKKMQYFH